ncbi:MAG: glycosyltransferase family 2 protein [Candidatus Gastranaerophilaceae bacterium]
MSDTILTIIIFTYNHKNFIARSIDSVVNQKTNYKYEIHLCDDASTDGTSDICREYAKKYPDKIKLFIQEKNTYKNKPNKRHFYFAYKRIKTKYWICFDGDDYLCNENHVQKAITALENNPSCSIYGSDSYWIDIKNNTTVTMVKDHYDDLKSGIYDAKTCPFILPSARVYRSDFKFYKIVPQLDSIIFNYFISQGKLYYDNEVDSVYNFSGDGIFSSLNKDARLDLDRLTYFQTLLINKFRNEELWFYKETITFPDDARKIAKYKKYYGTILGWYIWATKNFFSKYGLKIFSKDFIYEVFK